MVRRCWSVLVGVSVADAVDGVLVVLDEDMVDMLLLEGWLVELVAG